MLNATVRNLPFRLAGIILSLGIASFLVFVPSCRAAESQRPAGKEARVTSVNDGDTVTLTINGKVFRTRLIGIDAPEMGQEPWGRRSREHLRDLIKDGRWRVFVETDITQYDKYDRLLAYLRSPDGELLNERMLLDGYAVLFTIQPNSRYADRFKRAQQKARDEKKGVWGPDGLAERPLDYKKKHPRQ